MRDKIKKQYLYMVGEKKGVQKYCSILCDEKTPCNEKNIKLFTQKMKKVMLKSEVDEKTLRLELILEDEIKGEYSKTKLHIL